MTRKRDPGEQGSDSRAAWPDVVPPEALPGERLAKVIARAGLCSRRDAEAWIAAGRVSLNGAPVTSPAINVTAKDRVSVDGAPLPERERTRLFVYHKPAGLVTTSDDPQGRPTIFDALPKNLPRLLSVGRLDLGTEGLLLLTNDGGLARVLELPATGWLRRYRVRAHGSITQPELDKLRGGVTVDDVHYGPVEATLDRLQGANVWLTLAIREGKNREVRNVLRHLGLQVNRLIRVSFGPFQLGELAEGAVEEIRTRHLREQIGPRIAEEAGCDFTGPMTVRPEESEPKREPPPRREAERGERDRRDERGGRSEPRRTGERGPREERGGRGGRGEPRRADERGGRGERGRRGRSEAPQRSDKGRPFAKGQAGDEERPQGRPRRGHAWRQEDAPLRRHYRGKRRDEILTVGEVASAKRAGLLTDRKGRRVLVERHGAKPKTKPEPKPEPKRASRPKRAAGPKRDADATPDKPFGKPPRQGKAGRRDRSAGPRPARPGRSSRPDEPAQPGGSSRPSRPPRPR